MSGSFDVRDPDIEQRMRELATRIGAALEGTNFGFALFLVELNTPDGALFSIRSAQRDDMVPAIEAWCHRHRQ